MDEEKFSPEQSLRVIQSMIEKARNQFSENGHLYLLWGWVVLVCSITQFILIKFVHYEKHYLVWMLCWVAVIYQFIYLAKHRYRKVSTYADKTVGFVWLAFFICMMLVGFALGWSGRGAYKYDLIGPLFLVLYGMPTFLSGILLRFRPLVIGGIGCWVLSVLSHFITYEYQLLLLAAAMIIAWIIPGYILRNKYQKQNN